MVKMVHRYMVLAEATPPAIDLYGKLTEWSTSFKELLSKGKESSPESPETAPTSAFDTETDTSEPLAEANEEEKQAREERTPYLSPEKS